VNEHTCGRRRRTAAAVAAQRAHSLPCTIRSPVAAQVANHHDTSRCIGSGNAAVLNPVVREPVMNTGANTGSRGSNRVRRNTAGTWATRMALRVIRSAAAAADG
jgi:hypothetical protein